MTAGEAAGITVWRIAKHTPEFAADDLSGGGAKKTGGRWNSKGRAVLYASASIALATLETLAHLGDSIAVRNAFLVRIDIPFPVWERRSRLPVQGGRELVNGTVAVSAGGRSGSGPGVLTLLDPR